MDPLRHLFSNEWEELALIRAEFILDRSNANAFVELEHSNAINMYRFSIEETGLEYKRRVSQICEALPSYSLRRAPEPTYDK